VKGAVGLLALGLLAWSPAGQSTTLHAVLARAATEFPGRAGIWVKHLTTGETAGVRDGEMFNSASVIKIPVLVLALQMADRGEINLDERLTIRKEDIRGGSGIFRHHDAGLQPTLRDVLLQMIITSDNTATDLMIGVVGRQRVNQLLDSLGYRATRLRMTTGDLFKWIWVLTDSANARMSQREVFERGFPSDSGMAARIFRVAQDSTYWLGTMTAREAGRMLEELQLGKLAGKSGTDEMLGILRRQFYSSRLPQRLQFQVGIGHKTGDIPPVLGNDVGVMYPPAGPIVIAVFVNQNRGDFFALESAIGAVARDVARAWGGVK